MRWDIYSGAGQYRVNPQGSGDCNPEPPGDVLARANKREPFQASVVFWGEGKFDRTNSKETADLLDGMKRLKAGGPVDGTADGARPAAASLGTFDGVIDVAASYNRDDRNNVVLVATRNGDVQELYYQGSGQPGRSVIAHFDGIMAIAASYNADDQYRLAIVATRDGDVHEVYYHPTKGKGQSVIAHFNDIVDVAAFFNEDDQYRVVLVATRDGQVHEVFYHPAKGTGQSVIATYGGIVALAGDFVRGSNLRRALTLTADGRVHELLYGPTQSRQERVLGQYPGVSVAGSGRATLVVTTSQKLLALPAQAGGQVVELATAPGLRWVAVDYMNGRDVIYATQTGQLYRLFR
jgi:hypothetical protein